MSNKVERGPYNANGASPKYINDFSKALAGEVRILLDEVGKLRDERRALQYEIAELMAVKSKHGAGGEYSPNWQPKPEEALPLPQPVPAIENGPPVQAPSGWRIVEKKPERKTKPKQITNTLGPASSLPVAPEPPAWAQWKPNPTLSPVARQGTPSGAPLQGPSPPRMGIFGPPSPPLK